MDNTNYIYGGPNDDLTSIDMREDKSGDESSYIRGTAKPYAIIPSGNSGKKNDLRDDSYFQKSVTDFIDKSETGDDLPLEFKSSDNLLQVKKVESENVAANGSGGFVYTEKT